MYFGSHIRSQNLNIKVIPPFLTWVTMVIEVIFTIRETRSETSGLICSICSKEGEKLKDINSLHV